MPSRVVNTPPTLHHLTYIGSPWPSHLHGLAYCPLGSDPVWGPVFWINYEPRGPQDCLLLPHHTWCSKTVLAWASLNNTLAARLLGGRLRPRVGPGSSVAGIPSGHSRVGQGHSRVVDNLEPLPFLEGQVRLCSGLVVIERHEGGHTPCRDRVSE